MSTRLTRQLIEPPEWFQKQSSVLDNITLLLREEYTDFKVNIPC